MRTFILLAFIALVSVEQGSPLCVSRWCGRRKRDATSPLEDNNRPYAAEGGTFADKLTPEEKAAIAEYASPEQVDRLYKTLYAKHPDIREAHGFTDVPLEDLAQNDAYQAQLEAGGHLESFVNDHLDSLKAEEGHFTNAIEDPDVQGLDTNAKEVAIMTAIEFCDAADQDTSTLAMAFIKMVVHTTLPALKSLTNGEFNPDEFTANEKAAITLFLSGTAGTSPEKNEIDRVYKKLYARHPEIKIAHIGDVAIEDLDDNEKYQEMLGAFARMAASETEELDLPPAEMEAQMEAVDTKGMQDLEITADEYAFMIAYLFCEVMDQKRPALEKAMLKYINFASIPYLEAVTA